MGIGFHLLAGGKPLLRRDVITAAAGYPGTVFPVFTNGTMLDRAYLELFDRSRNLIPVLSIEGNETETDGRRGKGIYQTLLKNMEELRRRKLLFGVSVTVTAKNLECVSSRDFLNHLEQLGCRVVLSVEYVPVDPATRNLAFSAVERECLAVRQEELRKLTLLFCFYHSLGMRLKWEDAWRPAGDFSTLARMATPNHAPFPRILILV